eukprot:661969-Amphidinium_carterae.1
MALVLVEQKGPSPVPPYGVAGALAVPVAMLPLPSALARSYLQQTPVLMSVPLSFTSIPPQSD